MNSNPSCHPVGEEVPKHEVHHYGVAKPKGEGELFELEDVVEKPSAQEAPSNLAIAARYILPPEIFDAIDRTPPGKDGEIQLTDAIRLLMKHGCKVIGVKLSGGERRYDIGNFASYFRTFADFALADKELGPGFAEYLRTKLLAE